MTYHQHHHLLYYSTQTMYFHSDDQNDDDDWWRWLMLLLLLLDDGNDDDDCCCLIIVTAEKGIFVISATWQQEKNCIYWMGTLGAVGYVPKTTTRKNHKLFFIEWEASYIKFINFVIIYIRPMFCIILCIACTLRYTMPVVYILEDIVDVKFHIR